MIEMEKVCNIWYHIINHSRSYYFNIFKW